MARQLSNKKLARFIGDKELMQTIKGLQKEGLKRQVVVGGLKSAGRVIVNSAKRNTSHNSLKRSLKTRELKDKYQKQYKVKIGPEYRRGRKDYAPHAHLVEFGTTSVIKPTDSNLLVFKDDSGNTIFTKQVSGQSPQPFMRPAWDQNKRKLPEIIAQKLRESLVRFVKRNAKRLNIKI